MPWGTLRRQCGPCDSGAEDSKGSPEERGRWLFGISRTELIREDLTKRVTTDQFLKKHPGSPGG